ncbi:hypothetical protein NB037_03190 [Rathayibacter sp. ZW T2_19]|uniref:Uncharacterized protein n=1 Tax=Rathayibacter rubneri TaxID=2950106 RepID=A0A9X2ISE0_9MICO|nr:hypothetical protein [Rathayibacter rubneri]MCM6761413.1 hypothetical protein [Rathayibacter rubneri]
MRIRATKPEFWRSKTIAALTWETRFVLKGLESYVDDNGVGKDDIETIASDVFGRDLARNPRDTLARLTEAISVLHKHGLIARYSIEGEELLYIDKWKDLQRIDKPGRGRFPRPDGTKEYEEVVNTASYKGIRDTLASPPVKEAPVTGEQGNRGTGEQPSSSDADASDGKGLAPDVIRLCELLATLVRANGHKVGTVGATWWRSCERLIRIDGYKPEQIENVMRWATENEFWAANIRSMPTLRDKFSTLRMKAIAEWKANGDTGASRPTAVEANLANFNAIYGGDPNELEGSAPAPDPGVRD